MQELLKKLHRFKIHIGIADEKLDIQAPKGVMTEDLLEEIKLHKHELLTYIGTYKTKQEKRAIIPQASVQENYPVSSSQRRLWLLSQFEGGSVAYNMPIVFELEGRLMVNALEKAFRSLIERHESLRTNFKVNGTGDLRQLICRKEDIKFQLRYEDLSTSANSSEKIKECIQEDINNPFNLSEDSLLRAKLVKLGSSKYIFIVVLHHIISDQWSTEIMTKELFTLYASYSKGIPSLLLPLAIQYKDYTLWQQEQLRKDSMTSHKDYWIAQFSGELPVLNLPSHSTRPSIKTYKGKTIKKSYKTKLLTAFHSLCQAHGATLFMGLLSAIKVLLYRYTHQEDLIIGIPIAGRTHAALENQIGVYVNTLALRTRLKGKENFKELLAKVKTVTLRGYEHQEYPFDELLEHLPLKRDLSRNPLFDVLVTLQNIDNTESANNNLDGLTLKEYTLLEESISKLDLEFNFKETTKGFHLLLTYQSDIYSEAFAERMLAHIEVLLESILAQPEVPIGKLSYLTEKEKHQLLIDFNNTEAAYPKARTILDLFEEQVTKTPDAIAVIYESTQLTYRELNEQSNQLGSYLRAKYQIQPNDLVGIKLERSEKMVGTILGILKSGAAYVPIDITYPAERITYIEKDSNSKVVVDKEVLEEFSQVQKQYSKENIEKINYPEDLGYIIYTSGTMGHPKGVMITHKNAVELLYWCTREFDSSKFEIVYAVTSYCFDLSIYELFYTLSIGKKIRILSSPLAIKEYLEKDNKIVINTVPSVIRTLIEEQADFSAVSMLNMASEAIPVAIVKQLTLNKITVRNLYGPSEDTTYSTCYRLENRNYSSIPIGKPISNTQVYLLDEDLQPVPIGVEGKLYISGAGLSRGYLNKPELTQEKFIENPFKTGERMYDTGDLGRWLSDGNIEFLGRKDHQVKVRGYRIELEEIENQIALYSTNIKQALVEVKEQRQEKVLAAYLVSMEVIDKSALRSYLQGKLPEYMIPNYYVALETLPLSPNGKIDRKALPSISGEEVIRKEYIAPRTEVEKKLVELWQEVLGIEKVSITDNFFELGGNSLKIISIINRIEKNLGLILNVKDFFNYTTPLALAEFLSKSTTKIYLKEILPIGKKAYYQITYSQFGIWYECQKGIEYSVSYNMINGLIIKGVLNKKFVETSLKKLIEKHEILRTVFLVNELGVVQKIFELDEFAVNFSIEEVSFESKSVKDFSTQVLEEEKNHVFDLEQGPLFNFRYVEINNKDTIIIFNIHHIICDGLSINVIIKDFLEYYGYLNNTNNYEHKELPLQFKDYAHWINDRIEENLLELKNYWLNQLIPLPSPVMLKNTIKTITNKGKIITIQSEAALVEQVKSSIQKLNISEYIFYSTIAALLLNEWTGNDEIILLSPFSIRPNMAFENQVGLYLNTLPLLIRMEKNQTFEQLVMKVKEITIHNLEHQLYPFASMIDALKEKNSVIDTNLFNVMFTLQNQDSNEKIVQKYIPYDVDYIEQETNTSSKFDITFSVIPYPLLDVSIEYNAALFNEEEINQFANRYFELIELYTINSELLLA